MCNKHQVSDVLDEKGHILPDFFDVNRTTLFKKKSARTKLWQLDHNYHCAIIGTCLSLTEVKSLLKSLRIDCSKCNAYEIHTMIVTMISYNDFRSKRVQSYLDKKFSTALKKVKKMDEKALVSEWKSVLNSGNLVATFWAMISHPRCHTAMKRDIYGDIHMLSHLSGASNRVDLKRLDHLEKENIHLFKTAASEQEKAGQAKLDSLAERESIKYAEQANAELMRELTTLEKTNANLLASQSRKELQQLNLQTIRLNNKINAQANELEKQHKITDQLHTRITQQAKQQLRRASEVAIYKEEAEYLQALLSQQKQQDDCLFKQQNLCGQCVLYVGGKKNLIPHYRDLVEKKSGTFLHHDGGEEKSTQSLSKSLSRADIVIFPSDCISHEAYWVIKRACKKQQKPFEYLNSPGLHSLSHALNKISESPVTH